MSTHSYHYYLENENEKRSIEGVLTTDEKILSMDQYKTVIKKLLGYDDVNQQWSMKSLSYLGGGG